MKKCLKGGEKMRMRNLIIVLTLLFCMALSQIAIAFDGIMPVDLYTKNLTVTASVDVATGVLTSNVSISTSEKCEIYLTSDVYKNVNGEWQFVKRFRNPSSGTFTGTSKKYQDTCTVTKGYNYKVVVNAYVKSVADGISETITQDSKIISYK